LAGKASLALLVAERAAAVGVEVEVEVVGALLLAEEAPAVRATVAGAEGAVPTAAAAHLEAEEVVDRRAADLAALGDFAAQR
jgi:hypothetical protein